MANTTIKTRILLRNDTLANWESSTLVLNRGEVAIATLPSGGLAEVRIGTGSSTWGNSLKLNVNADQISGLIETIQGTAKQYQVVSAGDNSWKLQVAALSGGDWSDVAGSTWTVDFSTITADIDALSGAIDDVNDLVTDTRTTLNTVSSDYLTSADKTELSNALTALDDAKLAKSEFAALSNEIGLSAANSSNHVATMDDIKDIAGAMHFRGAVTPQEGETDLEALARVITDPASGDVAIITTNSKEYVYATDHWVELGAEDLYETKAHAAETYATKIEVGTISAGLTSDIDYLSGQIDSITDNYATKTELNDVSVALSTDYQGKIDGLTADVEYLSGAVDGVADTLNTVSSDYLTSADKTELINTIGTVSAETLVSANAYTDQKMDELSGGFLILDCGASTLREGEPTPVAP